MPPKTHEELENEIQKNKERIDSLTRDLKNGFKDDKQIIKDLEEKSKNQEREIEELKRKNELLEKELQKVKADKEAIKADNEAIKADNEAIKADNEAIKADIKKTKERIEKLEEDSAKEHNIMIICQIGTRIQRNMCNFVLGKHFKEDIFYNVKYMEDYISELKDTKEQEAARKRWLELDKEIPWDTKGKKLVDSLKVIGRSRNGIAHPELSETNIQAASAWLEKKKILKQYMVTNVKQLKKMWKISESLLQRKQDSESAKGDQVKETVEAKSEKKIPRQNTPVTQDHTRNHKDTRDTYSAVVKQSPFIPRNPGEDLGIYH